jgi:anthranilate phosphoribosyltransferase
VKQYIEKCLAGTHLTVDEAAEALELIMTNQATEAQIAGLLVALRAKGETVDEVVGFARTMRERAVRIIVEDENAIDMCGTGGDGSGSFNISTVASLVAAGAGVTVAKHGNRSVSSQSGSADLLAALGVNIQIGPDRVRSCIDRVGIGFLFAPMFHPAMKYAAKPRTELAVRTIFNILGPLTNPAGVRRQVVGTYAAPAAPLVAEALRRLGARKACVVHSDDGLDEVSVACSTTMFEVDGTNTVNQYRVSPSDFGLQEKPASSMSGGSKEENARIAMAILRNEEHPGRDVVLANAAVGIYVAAKALDFPTARAMAAESIDSGRARAILAKLVEHSNQP